MVLYKNNNIAISPVRTICAIGRDVLESTIWNLLKKYGVSDQVLSVRIFENSDLAEIIFTNVKYAVKIHLELEFNLTKGSNVRFIYVEPIELAKPGESLRQAKQVESLGQAKQVQLIERTSSVGPTEGSNPVELTQLHKLIDPTKRMEIVEPNVRLKPVERGKDRSNDNIVDFPNTRIQNSSDTNITARLPTNSTDNFTNLYMKNVPAFHTEDTLRTLFEKFGLITSCRIMMDMYGKSMGYGFVNFVKHEDAIRACKELNGTKWDITNKIFYLAPAQKRSERTAELREKCALLEAEEKSYIDEEGVCLLVSNLDENVSIDEIWELFRAHGEISDVKIVSQNDKSCHGFVRFMSRVKAVLAATKMQGFKLGTKNIDLFITPLGTSQCGSPNENKSTHPSSNFGVSARSSPELNRLNSARQALRELCMAPELGAIDPSALLQKSGNKYGGDQRAAMDLKNSGQGTVSIPIIPASLPSVLDISRMSLGIPLKSTTTKTTQTEDKN